MQLLCDLRRRCAALGSEIWCAPSSLSSSVDYELLELLLQVRAGSLVHQWSSYSGVNNLRDFELLDSSSLVTKSSQVEASVVVGVVHGNCSSFLLNKRNLNLL
ncbi:hypothetical protein FNV43_RR08217 [Rhamnella rubrinervis]|uniref:Uncharacterized protein n=1 Tax=Rhamnella rubrinervis TaxID=2594499 RepID=A0A8K0MNQ9_9ROSA|nr:hypothetical protein FNV43_RR08217 [Rhamnella rubrinervis]